jgi:hypothetical protein
MDRPYLRGVAGVTKNISAGLQDYVSELKGVEKGLSETDQASEFLA